MITNKLSVSNRLAALPVSAIRKLTPYAAEAKAKGVKVYHLNIGDPDVKTPDVMLDVLKTWNQNPIRYAQSQGEPEFVNALLWYYHRLGHKFVQRSNIIATVGGSEACVMALFAVANPGEEVLVFEPFYSNYATCAAIMGVKLVPVPTSIENGFHLPDRQAIESRISPKTRALLFCTPGNPTGSVYTREEMDLLVSVAKDHDLFLISDEVYREYVFGGREHVSILSYMEQIPEQAIMVDSLSKRYSLCGARLGVFLTLNEAMIKGVTRMAQARLSGGLIDQFVGMQLTHVPDAYIEAVQVEYQKRRDVLYAGLNSIPGVTMARPEGAFYSMVGLPVKDSDDFCLWLLSEYRSNNETVMLAPGSGFYATPGKGTNEVRVAYVLNTRDLNRCVELVRDALNVYQQTRRS
jgi:aspartate aminotransferase